MASDQFTGGVTDEKPGHAAHPLPGVQPVLLNAEGEEMRRQWRGRIAVHEIPLASILRTTWGDHERCRQTCFSAFKGMYFTGDGAKRDLDGAIRIIGRVDDVIDVSGHRFGTAEIESAINQARAWWRAPWGYPHDIKGQGHLRLR